MSENTVSILDGSTFLVSNLNGDFEAAPDRAEGLFYKDMRHLSKWKLTLNGKPLDVLSTDALEYYFVQHFCAPPPGGPFMDGELSVIRRRYIGDGLVEDLTVLNHGQRTLELELRVEMDADFADLFEVKDALKKKGHLSREAKDRQLVLRYKRDSFERATLIASTVPVSYLDSAGATFQITLPPKWRWNTKVNVNTVVGDEVHPPKFSTEAGLEMRHGLQQWLEEAPAVDSHIEAVRLYMRSLVDIAALRFRP
ncbi:MAG: glycogen debranching N-terminal domain-containing protein, partial [Terriglobales bacterium]